MRSTYYRATIGVRVARSACMYTEWVSAQGELTRAHSCPQACTRQHSVLSERRERVVSRHTRESANVMVDQGWAVTLAPELRIPLRCCCSCWNFSIHQLHFEHTGYRTPPSDRA